MTEVIDSIHIVRLHWEQVAQHLKLSEDMTITIWNLILSRHSESHRYYHNMSHLIDLMQLLNEYEHHLIDKNAVILSILFHDIIYNPSSDRNEDDSASLWLSLFENLIQPDLMEKVRYYIMATKAHDVSSSFDDDLKLFIDMDMSIVGRDEADYYLYASKIRKEYIHIDRQEYMTKRAQFLRSVFSENEKYIFASEIFRNRYEKQARDNMKWECQYLESGMIPGEND
jgi:predicted metal-dependent HD superfamily phosphohydrolase